MARLVTVNADRVSLPDGNIYDEGETATLSDEQYARLPQARFEGDSPILTDSSTGYVTADDDGNADLSGITDQTIRTISQYEDFEPGWSLILPQPGPDAPAVRVLIAAQSNISDFGLDVRDSEGGYISYIMDSDVASNLPSISTLLATFEAVQGYGGNWLYALTAIPLPNVD